jgi:hypothetical protein
MDDDRDATDPRDAGRELAVEFEALRPQLTRIAYGMLGAASPKPKTSSRRRGYDSGAPTRRRSKTCGPG